MLLPAWCQQRSDGGACDHRPIASGESRMYSLYYAPGAASMVVHWLLIELGVPHELRLVDTKSGEQKSPGYLALNPNGVVPTLIDDGVARFECGALSMLVAERHPEAGFAPAIDKIG